METRNCQNCKNDFTIEAADFSFYEKLKVPPPTWCPGCRFIRRAIFRNERKLFRNVDGITGEAVVSLFPFESGLPIYQDTLWFSDEWDPFSYGQEFDRSRSFLAQLYELSMRVPRMRGNVIRMERSNYSGNASSLKDCYLMFNSNYSENSAYGNAVDHSKNCFDNSHIANSERCYESFWITKSYDTHFSSECEDCVSVWFSKNCRGCTNCFGCVNLVNKSYYFFNQQLSKEEYGEKIKNLNLSSYLELEKIKKDMMSFWLKNPVRFMHGVRNVNVTGEYINNSKNARNSYLVRDAEDVAYVQYAQLPTTRDAMDCTVVGDNTELIYEASIAGWGSSQMKFCLECWEGGMDFEYSMYCGRKANHIFGCVGVRNGEYCILNKRYSKDEYYSLVEEIKQHMNDIPYIDGQGRAYTYGEFFPPEFSVYSYNNTIAYEHKEMSPEEARMFGMSWNSAPTNEYKVTLRSEDVPDDIQTVTEDILHEVIHCAECGSAYRIIESELQFLRQIGVALPRRCVDCRHRTRIKKRNKNYLYSRKCGCGGVQSENGLYLNTVEHSHKDGVCQNEFQTAYAPERPEIVYCEKCYQAEVY